MELDSKENYYKSEKVEIWLPAVNSSDHIWEAMRKDYKSVVICRDELGNKIVLLKEPIIKKKVIHVKTNIKIDIPEEEGKEKLS